MNHHASPDFWACYRALPAPVQGLADRAFALLKANPRHPSLRFKRVGRFWSVLVALQRLNAEYAKLFGIETPNWPPKAAPKS